MKNKYTIGSFNTNGILNKNGWFIGQFMPLRDLEHDTNIEISVKKLPKGWGMHDEHPLHYHKVAKEFGIVTNGSARVIFDNKELIIKKGDYYILSQGCEEKYLEILEDMELITIKTPSVSNDKILVD